MTGRPAPRATTSDRCRARQWHPPSCCDGNETPGRDAEEAAVTAPPTNDDELEGLDPTALMEAEARRIERFLTDSPPEVWQRASRCEGWTVRDVLAHLAASEEYYHACLDGRVQELMTGMFE